MDIHDISHKALLIFLCTSYDLEGCPGIYYFPTVWICRFPPNFFPCLSQNACPIWHGQAIWILLHFILIMTHVMRILSCVVGSNFREHIIPPKIFSNHGKVIIFLPSWKWNYFAENQSKSLSLALWYRLFRHINNGRSLKSWRILDPPLIFSGEND